jgi:hypothetical protein
MSLGAARGPVWGMMGAIVCGVLALGVNIARVRR